MKFLISLSITLSLFYCVHNFSIPGFNDFTNAYDSLKNTTSEYFNSNNNKNNTNTNDKSSKNQSSSNDVVCYGPLGCFERSYYSKEGLSPIGWFAPSDPSKLDIKIIYFNDLNDKGDPYKFNSTSIKEYERNTTKNYIIIHGWQSEWQYESWIDELKDTILEVNNGSANVFVVDWSKLASSILYPESAEDTKLVGRAVGYFILKTLVAKYNVKCDNIHILGHSLGGQTAGFAGKFTKSNNCTLGRITGLDPAGPFFRNKNTTTRLAPGDAKYVDVIHTNQADIVLTGLGTTQKSGDVDFFPNGGSTQTGCGIRDSVGNVIKNGLLEAVNAPSCSHVRAPQIYATNYDQLAECQLIAYQCKDYDSFTRGECGDCGNDNSKCRLVGLSKYYDARKYPFPKDKNIKYFLKTTEESPYCLHTYQVKIKISSNVKARAVGDFYLNIIGSKRDANDVKLAGPLTGFEANKTYTVLLEQKLPLDELEKVEIYFNENLVGDLISIVRVKMFVDEIQVNYMSHIDPKYRKERSGTFIPPSQNKSEVSKASKKRSVFSPSD